ncbi:MAG: hypothetical protein U0744_07835 [Gemmataceae bacterium]
MNDWLRTTPSKYRSLNPIALSVANCGRWFVTSVVQNLIDDHEADEEPDSGAHAEDEVEGSGFSQVGFFIRHKALARDDAGFGSEVGLEFFPHRFRVHAWLQTNEPQVRVAWIACGEKSVEIGGRGVERLPSVLIEMPTSTVATIFTLR